MSRLIDADELMRTLGITDMDCGKCAWGENQYCTRESDFTDACCAIEDAPTIEERKSGKWIKHKDYPGLAYLCSECNLFTTNRSYYCPNCGARMEE